MVAVPGRLRQRQIEQGSEPLGDIETLVVERGERADGTAELQHQRLLAQAPQPLARARQRRGVTGQLESEWHRQGMLQPGSPDRGGPAMAAGERGEALDGVVEIDDQRIDRRAQVEHERSVDDVLATGAPVHPAGRGRVGLGDLGAERLDQRDRDIAGDDRLLTQRLNVVALGFGGIGDLVAGQRRYDADGGFRPRQRDDEVEHTLQPRAVVEHGAHGGARDQRGQ